MTRHVKGAVFGSGAVPTSPPPPKRPAMSLADRDELAWWRELALHFEPHAPLPKPGTGLRGTRFICRGAALENVLPGRPEQHINVVIDGPPPPPQVIVIRDPRIRR